MRKSLSSIIVPLFLMFIAALINSCRTDQQVKDWLIDGSTFKAAIEHDSSSVTLTNGLVSRSFSTSPGGATIGFENIMAGKELLRAVKPEAVLGLNGKQYKVGGLSGQPVKKLSLQRVHFYSQGRYIFGICIYRL